MLQAPAPAPAAAPAAEGWPPTLRKWVERAFAACKSDADRDFLGPLPGQRESFSLRTFSRPGWDDVPSAISVVMAIANIGLVLLFAYMIIVDVWKMYKRRRGGAAAAAAGQAGGDHSSDGSMVMQQQGIDDIFRKGDVTVNPMFENGFYTF